MQNHLQSKKHKEMEQKEVNRVEKDVEKINEKNKGKGIEVLNILVMQIVIFRNVALEMQCTKKT